MKKFISKYAHLILMIVIFTSAILHFFIVCPVADSVLAVATIFLISYSLGWYLSRDQLMLKATLIEHFYLEKMELIQETANTLEEIDDAPEVSFDTDKFRESVGKAFDDLNDNLLEVNERYGPELEKYDEEP